MKPNKYLFAAVAKLLEEHIKNKIAGTVTDDKELAELKDKIIFDILNKGITNKNDHNNAYKI
jgi:hypothetical protein